MQTKYDNFPNSSLLYDTKTNLNFEFNRRLSFKIVKKYKLVCYLSININEVLNDQIEIF